MLLSRATKQPSFPADPYWKPLLEAVYYQSWTGFSSIVQRIPTLEGARCRELTKAFRKVDKIVWKAVGDEVANRHRTTVCTWLRRNDASEEQLRQVVTSLEWLIRESRKATARQDSVRLPLSLGTLQLVSDHSTPQNTAAPKRGTQRPLACFSPKFLPSAQGEIDVEHRRGLG